MSNRIMTPHGALFPRLQALQTGGRKSLLAGLAALALAGCETNRLADQLHPLYTDPAKRHEMSVAANTAVLGLGPVTGDAQDKLDANLATMQFLRAYQQEAQSPLYVSVARGDRHRHGVAQRLDAVRGIARATGIPPDRIRYANRASASAGAVTLSYHRVVVVAPECGDWSEDVGRNPEKLPYPNYGCASQRNLAAMIANPTDVAFPANETLRQSDNRAQKYKEFKVPPSETKSSVPQTINSAVSK